jgi:hypothetical protein
MDSRLNCKNPRVLVRGTGGFFADTLVEARVKTRADLHVLACYRREHGAIATVATLAEGPN